MISKSRVDRSEFQVTFIPQGMNFLRELLLLQSSTMRKGSSDVHQDFALSAFNNQVRIDFWKKCIKRLTSKLAVMNRAFFKRNTRIPLLLIIGTAKFITNPIHNTLISISNFDVSVIVKNWFGSKFGFSMKKPDEKTTFPIDKSCKICEFCVGHKTSLFKTDQYAIDPCICTA